jgi:hypothetical protein
VLTALRPTAVLLAFFGGYVIPVTLLFAAGAMAFPDGNAFSSPLLSVLIVSSYIVLPLLSGVLAGVLAHQAPFLHAIAASLLGSAMYALMHESITATEGIWWVAVNAAGAIAGAWLSTRMAKERNPGGL